MKAIKHAQFISPNVQHFIRLSKSVWMVITQILMEYWNFEVTSMHTEITLSFVSQFLLIHFRDPLVFETNQCCTSNILGYLRR